MLLNAPPNAQTLTVNNQTFTVVNGQVDIPDNLITSRVWEQGFTVATLGKTISDKTSDTSKDIKL